MRFVLSRPLITGTGVLLLGFFLAGGGAWLLALGGTAYYLLAGLGLVATGVLLIRGSRLALAIYAAVWIATLAWAFGEVGFAAWRLMPRVLAPTLLGLWLAMSWVAGRLGRTSPGRPLRMRSRSASVARWSVTMLGTAALALVLILAWRASSAASADAAPVAPATSVAWPAYGNSVANDRFSAAAQITPANVHDLHVAWTYHTGDLAGPDQHEPRVGFSYEVTPIEVGDTLYGCTPHSWVFALDARTGRQKWRFDPHVDTSHHIELSCRGVAFYQAPPGTVDCPRRIIAPLLDDRMAALDADTGKPCETWGEHGFADLNQGLGDVPLGYRYPSSAPMVVGDRVISSGWVTDARSVDEPSGVIQALDANTGKMAWTWDLGREPPNKPLGPGEIHTRGTPNSWGPITADPKLGLVYLGLGDPAVMYWLGKETPAESRYDSSLVALDIETGDTRWSFQTTHHDIWDMDVPTGPSLVDLPQPGGGTVPALVQTTKRGEVFLLDRRDGHPLAAVTEKPVPTDAAPGDHLSPTQPYSTGMPSFSPATIKETDLWGATPIDQLVCRIEFHRMHYEGQFTPIQSQWTLVFPAFYGVIDWYGPSIDTDRSLMVFNRSYLPFALKFVPYAEAVAAKLIAPWDGRFPPPVTWEGPVNPMYGTPYVAVSKPWLGPFSVPCLAPPWGLLTAVDLRARKVAWDRPLGTAADTGPFGTHVGLPLPLGVFSQGGTIATKGGIVFIAATVDQYLRAFDIRSGEELWAGRLPAGGQATPMTYVDSSGAQFVVIAAGGHGELKTREGDSIVAYSLPHSP